MNVALAKSEARLNGFDDAIVLSDDGHVSEVSAANLFVIRDGVATTPGSIAEPARGCHPPIGHALLAR